jgi:hypothetical protein
MLKHFGEETIVEIEKRKRGEILEKMKNEIKIEIIRDVFLSPLTLHSLALGHYNTFIYGLKVAQDGGP